MYNGKDKGAFWKKKVSFYIASKCPEITRVLHWVRKTNSSTLKGSGGPCKT